MASVIDGRPLTHYVLLMRQLDRRLENAVTLRKIFKKSVIADVQDQLRTTTPGEHLKLGKSLAGAQLATQLRVNHVSAWQTKFQLSKEHL